MTDGLDFMLGHPVAIFAMTWLLLVVATYLGAHAERRWRALRKEEEDLIKVIVGASLTLLGLIVGFSFSMAVNHYEQRKTFEEKEADTIGTGWLRAELLQTADAEEAKRLLHRYVDLRIAYYEEQQADQADRLHAQAAAVQEELWAVVRAAAVREPTPIMALATAGINDVINSQGSVQAAWWNRVPPGAWAFMAAIAMCCCAMIGYSSHVRRRGLLLVLPVILSLAFFFIADIDTPRRGFIHVIPRNLISVSQAMSSVPARSPESP